MQTAIFPVKHREKLVLSRFHTKQSYRVTIFSINAESTMFIADGNRNLRKQAHPFDFLFTGHLYIMSIFTFLFMKLHVCTIHFHNTFKTGDKLKRTYSCTVNMFICTSYNYDDYYKSVIALSHVTHV